MLSRGCGKVDTPSCSELNPRELEALLLELIRLLLLYAFTNCRILGTALSTRIMLHFIGDGVDFSTWKELYLGSDLLHIVFLAQTVLFIMLPKLPANPHNFSAAD